MASSSLNLVLFREVQYFRSIWFLAAVTGITAIVWFAFVTQVILGIPFGDNPGPDELIWFLIISFGTLFPIFLVTAHLTVEVRTDGIWLRFFPLHRRMWKIAPDEFYSHEVITYQIFRDYGGWGIRYGNKGTAYNVSGNRGVLLRFPRNKSIMIGSQHPEDLNMAILSIRKGT